MEIKTIFTNCMQILNYKISFGGVTFSLFNVLMYSIFASIVSFIIFRLMR